MARNNPKGRFPARAVAAVVPPGPASGDITATAVVGVAYLLWRARATQVGEGAPNQSEVEQLHSENTAPRATNEELEAMARRGARWRPQDLKRAGRKIPKSRFFGYKYSDRT